MIIAQPFSHILSYLSKLCRCFRSNWIKLRFLKNNEILCFVKLMKLKTANNQIIDISADV